MNEELFHVELNKRRNNLIINDRHNVCIINNREDVHVFNSQADDRDDEVYMHDMDDYHNNDRDDELNSDRGDEDNCDGDDGHNSDKCEEFEEFANPEEYEDVVEHFTVPSGHCEPSREPCKVVSPTDCVPYTWKAPDFKADDVV